MKEYVVEKRLQLMTVINEKLLNFKLNLERKNGNKYRVLIQMNRETAATSPLISLQM